MKLQYGKIKAAHLHSKKFPTTEKHNNNRNQKHTACR